jgi:hypothetical protein
LALAVRAVLEAYPMEYRVQTAVPAPFAVRLQVAAEEAWLVSHSQVWPEEAPVERLISAPVAMVLLVHKVTQSTLVADREVPPTKRHPPTPALAEPEDPTPAPAVKTAHPVLFASGPPPNNQKATLIKMCVHIYISLQSSL